MRHLKGIATTAACLEIAILLLARCAHAGCNTIPEAELSFRGVSGEINRAFFQTGDPVRITLGSAAGIPRISDAKDLAVIVAIKSVDAESQRGAATMPSWTRPKPRRSCWVKELFCPAPAQAAGAVPLTQVKVPGVELLQSFPAPPVVAFTFPETNAAGPAVIAIGSVSEGFSGGDAVLSCHGEATKGLLACFDTLQPPAGTVVPSCSGTIQTIVLPASNDFRSLCTKQDAAPNCTGTATELRFAIDAAGNAYIPVHWGNILGPGPGGPASYPRRRVRGNSAVRAFPDEVDRIVVPNADYLGTSTLLGTGFSPEPEFEPDNTPSSNHRNVLALTGRSDKGDSVLHVCRRVPAQFTCGPGPHTGESCDPGSSTSSCPGNCEPVFFTCNGGPRDGRPCTREADCGIGGACQAGSTCMQQGVDVKTPCQTDADCAAGQECGPGLFEFRYQGRAKKNIVTIPRAGDVSKGNVGVCDGPPYKGILCPNDAFCKGSFPENPHCVAVRAHAGQFE